MSATAPRCRICGATDNLRFCGVCGVYLCLRHENDWPARIVAATKKLLGLG